MRIRKGFLTVISGQVLLQLVPLVLQHFAQIRRHLTGDLLDESIKLSQVVRQPHQLVERSHLKHRRHGQCEQALTTGTHLEVGNVELVVDREGVLLAGEVVHSLPGLLASLVAWGGYQPVLRHLPSG